MIKLFDQEYAVQQTLKAQREEVREEALAEGRAEGREEGMLKAFFNLVQEGLLSLNIAAIKSGHERR